MEVPRSTAHRSVPLIAALVGIATGLAISTSSARDVRDAIPTVADLKTVEIPDPLRGLTQTERLLAMRSARTDLEDGRPWAAWKTLRDHVEAPESATPAAVLLAAQAAAGWGGWRHVRELLSGREWLDSEGRGEGWFLLARAEEEREAWGRSAEAYRRYLAGGGASRGVAHARLGGVLRSSGDRSGAAAAYGAAANELPAAGDWFRALHAELLAPSGDEAVMRVASSGTGPARVRHARAQASYWSARGDTARAVARLAEEGLELARLDAAPDAASLLLTRARLLAGSGNFREARELLRQVAAEQKAVTKDRLTAATLLGTVRGTSTAEEELARAGAYEAARKPGLAARSLRKAVALGAPDDPATQLRRGVLLFEERDYDVARAALLAAAARLADPEQAAEAELYAARSLFRDVGAQMAELRALSERRPGTAAAGTALFLLGDRTGNREQAIALYRRAAAVPASPSAREALFRVGDRSAKNADPAGAVRAWEEYVGRYPSGQQTAQAAYLAGVIHERAGRDGAARAMYVAATAAEPTSYYAVRAADRAGIDPLSQTAAAARPWVEMPSDGSEAGAALRRLDILDKVGLEEAWSEELAAQTHRLQHRPAALLALGQGLADRGHAVEAIRLGRRLLEQRGGQWDEPLLRVVFPFPFRGVLEGEAKRTEVDPFLLAALVRQESSFDPQARSRVGATGLSQIMPATGEWLAKGAGVDEFHPSLLAVPEINLRMGARYLRDQLRRYDGARDLALAAYNAGPSRADRWRREIHRGNDVDAFRERIPFDETREYVKLVLRNAALYRRLYGQQRSPGLARPE